MTGLGTMTGLDATDAASATRGAPAAKPTPPEDASVTAQRPQPPAALRLAGRVRRRAGVPGTRSRQVPPTRVRALDDKLMTCARGMAQVRLELGNVLDDIATRGEHHRAGFSSLRAYALQLTGRSSRWTSTTRTVARRLRSLPKLQAALASGALSWSMAELVAQRATPESDELLTELALGSTVRQVREIFRSLGQMSATVSAGASANDQGCGDEGAGQMSATCTVPAALAANDRDAAAGCVLTLTMDRQDAWLLSWTRRFFEHLCASEVSTDTWLGSLLAEAFSGIPHEDGLAVVESMARAGATEAKTLEWRRTQAAWREESERRCEPNIPPREARVEVKLPDAGLAPRERVRLLAQLLAEREVELASTAVAFHEIDGWLRMGFASEEHYARERLGLSGSSFRAKVALGRRLHAPVREALASGKIGYESALALTRIANEASAAAWVERATRRTVKHLLEEVQAAELAGIATPPSEEVVRAAHALETQLLEGKRDAVLAARERFQSEAGADAGQMSAPRVCLRLRVTRDTARFYRHFEERAARFLGGMSFVRYLCDAFWEVYKYACAQNRKWAHIYARDRYTCASPVCSRHDVTPHHYQRRSQGGSDEDENLGGLCLWCHIEGVHGGRIRLTGTASRPSWKIGWDGALVVEGRQLLAA